MKSRTAQSTTPSLKAGRCGVVKVLGDDLLSHADAHYHWRWRVSLPSSGWDRVGPRRYGRQALEKGWAGSHWRQENDHVVRRMGFELYGQAFEQLVRVSSTCYHAYTPRLSTRWSSWALILSRRERSHLGARFPLRCFQRLSLPNLATRQCHWRDNRNTRDSFTPVLSY